MHLLLQVKSLVCGIQSLLSAQRVDAHLLSQQAQQLLELCQEGEQQGKSLVNEAATVLLASVVADQVPSRLTAEPTPVWGHGSESRGGESGTTHEPMQQTARCPGVCILLVPADAVLDLVVLEGGMDVVTPMLELTDAWHNR